jgi:hypothetical protein
MTKNEAIEFFGTASALAAALDITPGAITQWKDPIARDWQITLEELSKGKLRADLSPELRRLLSRKVSA